MTRLTCIIIFILFMQVFSFSQTTRFNFPVLDFSAGTKPSFTLFKLNSSCNSPSFILIKPVKQAKKPVFCRMEDKIYRRYNIWILLRAGSDEEYRKLTRVKD